MNVKRVVITNVISIVALGLIYAISIIVNIFPLSVFLGVCWLAYVLYANYFILMKSNDIESRLDYANKHNFFDGTVKIVKKHIKSMESRQDLFDSMAEDDKIKQVCMSVEEQFYINVDYIIKYMSSFDYVLHPNNQISRIHALVNQNQILIDKVNLLVEQLIEVDKSTDNLDTSMLDDIIESLRSMSNE